MLTALDAISAQYIYYPQDSQEHTNPNKIACSIYTDKIASGAIVTLLGID